MDPIRILIAEDDVNIRIGLVDTLESEGYQVRSAIDGQEALALFKTQLFDLVLLDIMMPEKSGYDVCREIRAKDEEIPIIMLTAKGEEIDKVLGLKLGADDYITKPFGVHELLARIDAVLRRTRLNRKKNEPLPSQSQAVGIFFLGDLKINPQTYKLINGDIEYDLSRRELNLLLFFHAHPNEVLSRDRILNAVWGIDYYGTTRTLDQHIAQLRKKIEIEPASPQRLTTVHGVGYRFNWV